MAAPPMDAHRLVDSLTAHISLYSSTSTAAATATTAPRAAVLRWFASLAPPHRQAALTVADPAFLQILLQMQSRLRRSGHGFFLLLPDIPTPAALPSLLFRRSRGLLARASAANEPERLLARSLRLFSSSDGGGGGLRGFRCSADGLDACTVAAELVRDADRFVAAMDGVSGGRFLRGEEKGLGEDWFEFAWLKEKGYYSLEAFVANKLELALRLSWMNATGGKRRGGGGGGGKAKEGIAGVSANVFWRKKGCLDWWDRMEPHLKDKVLRVVFGKSAKTLALEVGKVVKDAAEDGAGFFSVGSESSVRYGPIMSWRKDNIDFYPGTVHNGKRTSVTNCITSLMILHEMSIAITDRLHLKNGEELLFSSLSSVYTFSDCVMRGVRALLGEISSDHVKVDLLGEETSKVTPKKSKTKVKNKECGKKRISAAEKPLKNEKPFKEDASGTENKGSCVLNSDDVHVDCGVERITKSADNKGDKCTKTLSTDFAKESIHGNADCEVHHTVKKSRKKSNKRKKSRFKEATNDNDSQKRMETTSSAATCRVDELHGISISTRGVIDNVDRNPSVDSPDINDVGENRTDDGSCIIMNVEGEPDSASVPIIDTAEVGKVFHKSDTDAPEGSIVKEPIVAQDLNTLVYGKEATGYFPRAPTSTVGGLSYEWPSWRPVYYPSVYSPHLPPATDRLHLDVGHNWRSQLNQSFFASRHQTGNALVDSGWGQILPSGLDSTDDWDSHWTVDEEAEFHTYSSRDYNQYFGGGIMYWNPADHGSTGFSRPPSLSSEDSSWAWHEAELSRVVDDMVGFSASYGANSLTSPTAAPFCSPFDPVGPTQQPVGFVVSGNDALAKDATVEDKASGTLNNTPGGFVEGLAADSLPYPILRPLIVPNLSKKESGSEYKLTHDRKSPCLPPTRRETPRIKRPPSPVIRCIAQGPRPPPPSPMSDSRKHRGFPAVRSGSSSPRNWGVRSWYHDGITNDEDLICPNGTDVIWPSWRGKGVGPSKMAQSLPSSLVQDRLLAISQLAVDHDHPDLSLPLQPPNIQTSPPYKACMSVMHNILHEEIDSFCKQVGDANLIRKPYVNWAVKRVARSLQVLWPRSRTTIFGSNATGLALPTSDVDLVVILPPVRNLEPIKEAGILEGRNGIKETCLQHAARYLGNQEWVKSESLKTVENTAIPVIKLVAEVPHDYVNANGRSLIEFVKNDIEGMVKDGGNLGNFGLSEHEASLWQLDSTMKNKDGTDVRLVRLDISFKSPAHTGLQTTDLVRELIEQFPAATPLALVVKQFLADRSLDHSYSGGLSSYCLVLLIIRYLQHEHHVGCSTKNLGSLLMDFLYFFGNVFDPRQMRISIQGTGVYVNRERGHSIDPLHIDDPLCPMNNVGRNCFRIHQCVKAFADAYTVLENELSHLSPSNDDPIEKDPVKLLPKIIPSINHVSKI